MSRFIKNTKRIDQGYCHCVICNTVIENSDILGHALLSTNHNSLLKEALISDKLTVNTIEENRNSTSVENTLSVGKKKKKFCVICNQFFSRMDTHLKNKKHLQNSQSDFHYMLAISGNNYVTCVICDIAIEDNLPQIAEHFKSSHHVATYNNYLKRNHLITDKNHIYCTKCEVKILTKNELKHVDTKKHKKNVEKGCENVRPFVSDSKVYDVNGDKEVTNLPDNITPAADNIYKTNYEIGETSTSTSNTGIINIDNANGSKNAGDSVIIDKTNIDNDNVNRTSDTNEKNCSGDSNFEGIISEKSGNDNHIAERTFYNTDKDNLEFSMSSSEALILENDNENIKEVANLCNGKHLEEISYDNSVSNRSIDEINLELKPAGNIDSNTRATTIDGELKAELNSTATSDFDNNDVISQKNGYEALVEIPVVVEKHDPYHFCYICRVSLPNNKYNINNHNCGKRHRERQGILKYYQMVFGTPNTSFCIVCRVYVTRDERNMLQHIKENSHSIKYAEKLAENCITVTEGDVFCKICNVSCEVGCEFLHCFDQRHISNLVIHKQLMKKGDTNESDYVSPADGNCFKTSCKIGESSASTSSINFNENENAGGSNNADESVNNEAAVDSANDNNYTNEVTFTRDDNFASFSKRKSNNENYSNIHEETHQDADIKKNNSSISHTGGIKLKNESGLIEAEAKLSDGEYLENSSNIDAIPGNDNSGIEINSPAENIEDNTGLNPIGVALQTELHSAAENVDEQANSGTDNIEEIVTDTGEMFKHFQITIYCDVCKVYVTYEKKKILEHIEGEDHLLKYAEISAENRQL